MALRLLGVQQEMQDRDEDEPDRLGEVNQPACLGMGQNRGRIAQVSLDNSGPAVAGQQLAALGHGDRVAVGVQHPRVRRDQLGDLVHVARGRDAGADVDELADARLLREEPHRTAQESPVRPAGSRDPRVQGLHPGAQLAVGRQVMRPAQPVVIDPRDARLGRIDSGLPPAREPARASHVLALL